jgi:hypothetical protein
LGQRFFVWPPSPSLSLPLIKTREDHDTPLMHHHLRLPSPHLLSPDANNNFDKMMNAARKQPEDRPRAKPTAVALVAPDKFAMAVPFAVLAKMGLFKEMFEDDSDYEINYEGEGGVNRAPGQMVVYNVQDLMRVEVKLPRHVLKKVVRFANHDFIEPLEFPAYPLLSLDMNDLVQPWYARFITTVDPWTLNELLVAAEYLDYGNLRDLTVLAIAIWLGIQREPRDIEKMTLSLSNIHVTDDESEAS